jgi:hypothetical protein
VDYRDDREYERLNEGIAKSNFGAVAVKRNEKVPQKGLEITGGVRSDDMMFTLSWSLEKDKQKVERGTKAWKRQTR